MIKAILFDLDGTLTDTLSTIAHFGNYALSFNGFPPIPTARYRYLVGDGRDILIHRMLAEHGADTKENYLAVGEIYDREYEANKLYGTKAYTGIVPLLDQLQDAGILLCVFSNKPHDVVVGIVGQIFGDRFDLVCGQKAGVPIKPAPDGALHICKKLNLRPEACLFVGDTNVDIRTAKNAGMYSAGVLWGFRDFDELHAAGADFIVENPGEIAEIVLQKIK